jgi:hypothetical protein
MPTPDPTVERPSIGDTRVRYTRPQTSGGARMDKASQLEDLKEAHDQAYGALGAAEEIGWLAAFLGALLIQERFGHWWISVPGFFVGYFAVTYQYRKADTRAQDAYYRAAGLGKYSFIRDRTTESDASA